MVLYPDDNNDDDNEALTTPTTTTTVTTEHVSQYDILVYEKDNELDFLPSSCSDPPPPHIGNNRLKVFLKMNMHNFVTATTPEEQQHVIDTILGLVASQCQQSTSTSNDDAPPSSQTVRCVRTPDRFWMLQAAAGGENTWTACSTCTAREFIQGLLEQEQQLDILQAAEAAAATTQQQHAREEDEKKRRRRSSLLRRSMSSGNMIEDQKKRVAYRRSVLMQLETLDVSDDGESSDDEEVKILHVTTAMGRTKQKDDDDDDDPRKPAAQQKDPSSSKQQTTGFNPEDAPSPSSAEDKRVTEGRPDNDGEDDTENNSVSTELHSNFRALPPPLKRSTSLTSLMETGTATSSHVVLTAEALDVILIRRDDTTCPFELVANHTGNNRLLVMVHQRSERYETISDDTLQVSRLCRELVETICTFYNGRFLVEQATASRPEDNHTSTTDVTPSTYFIKLTDDQAATALASVFRSEAQATTAQQQAALMMSLHQQQLHPVVPATTTKQSAMDAIAALSAGTALASEAHKTALHSLKQKKKRQDTQNKITRNYARFGTGPAVPPLGELSATTGIPDSHPAAAVASQHLRGHLVDHRSQSVGLIGVQTNTQTVPEPLAVMQRRASASDMIMPARRPTLSAFSAGMIEDMLHRLDVEAQEVERQREFNRGSSHNPHMQFR